MAEQNNETHFTKVFWFGCFNVAFVFTYLFAITFKAIPKENQRFVDIAIGLLIGSVINNILGFFFGGSLQANKKPIPPSAGTTTADITASITTEPEPSTPEK